MDRRHLLSVALAGLSTGCLFGVASSGPTLEVRARAVTLREYADELVERPAELDRDERETWRTAAEDGTARGTTGVYDSAYVLFDGTYYRIESTQVGTDEYRVSATAVATLQDGFTEYVAENLVLFAFDSAPLSASAAERIETAIETGEYRSSPLDETDDELRRYFRKQEQNYPFLVSYEDGYYVLDYVVRSH